MVDLGLRVNKLGRSSVTYEIGIFERNVADVRAVAGFTHVFVERDTSRPATEGMPSKARDGLSRLLSAEKSKL